MRRARDTNKNKRLFLPEQEGSLEVRSLLWPFSFAMQSSPCNHLQLQSSLVASTGLPDSSARMCSLLSQGMRSGSPTA